MARRWAPQAEGAPSWEDSPPDEQEERAAQTLDDYSALDELQPEDKHPQQQTDHLEEFLEGPEVGDYSASGRDRRSVQRAWLGPSFCPAANCSVGEQFKLKNDCCSYCKTYDFCTMPKHWLSETANSGERSPPPTRCHRNAECTNLGPTVLESLGAQDRGLGGWGNLSQLELGVEAMFACKCLAGFEGDGLTRCQDVDECADPRLNDCDPQTTRCVNTPGSFRCKCRSGFRPIRLANEAAHFRVAPLAADGQPTEEMARNGSGNLGAQDPRQEALGPLGEEQTLPVLRAGERRALQRCLDVDECAHPKLNKCHPQARCSNEPGSYRCQCKRGHLGNGFECHRWLSSGGGVAAYLHTHTPSGPARGSDALPDTPLGTQWPGSAGRAQARVYLPLNDEDEDEEEKKEDEEEEADEERPTLADPHELDELAADERSERGATDPHPAARRKQPSGPPSLSDSRWEPLLSPDQQESAGQLGAANLAQQQQQQQQVRELSAFDRAPSPTRDRLRRPERRSSPLAAPVDRSLPGSTSGPAGGRRLARSPARQCSSAAVHLHGRKGGRGRAGPAGLRSGPLARTLVPADNRQ